MLGQRSVHLGWVAEVQEAGPQKATYSPGIFWKKYSEKLWLEPRLGWGCVFARKVSGETEPREEGSLLSSHGTSSRAWAGTRAPPLYPQALPPRPLLMGSWSLEQEASALGLWPQGCEMSSWSCLGASLCSWSCLGASMCSGSSFCSAPTPRGCASVTLGGRRPWAQCGST